MDCPKCIGRLQEKIINFHATSKLSELKGAGISYELKIDQCFTCNGVWFDRGELDRYITDKITVIDSPSMGQKSDHTLNKKEGPCPRCGITLDKKPSPYLSGLITDICGKCQGIWLDPQEIDRLERKTKKEKKNFLQIFFQAFMKPKD